MTAGDHEAVIDDDDDRPQFSVVLFYDDGTHAYAQRFVDGERAVRTAKLLTDVAGSNVDKVIITDGGDNTVFMWEKGKGITWPTKEALRGRHQPTD